MRWENLTLGSRIVFGWAALLCLVMAAPTVQPTKPSPDGYIVKFKGRVSVLEPGKSARLLTQGDMEWDFPIYKSTRIAVDTNDPNGYALVLWDKFWTRVPHRASQADRARAWGIPAHAGDDDHPSSKTIRGGRPMGQGERPKPLGPTELLFLTPPSAQASLYVRPNPLVVGLAWMAGPNVDEIRIEAYEGAGGSGVPVGTTPWIPARVGGTEFGTTLSAELGSSLAVLMRRSPQGCDVTLRVMGRRRTNGVWIDSGQVSGRFRLLSDSVSHIVDAAFDEGAKQDGPYAELNQRLIALEDQGVLMEHAYQVMTAWLAEPRLYLNRTMVYAYGQRAKFDRLEAIFREKLKPPKGEER